MPKIKFEDVINKVFTDDKQKNALDLAAHIRALDLPLQEYGKEQKTYWFNIEYKGVGLCYIRITQKAITVFSSQVPCSWIYWSDDENDAPHAEPIVDENIKKYVWKRVRKCSNCGCDSAPGRRKNILGKEYDNVCVSALGFHGVESAAKSLSSTELESIKQMITTMKNDIDNGAGADK